MTTFVSNHFPFLQLPAELRNQIYALLLTDPHRRIQGVLAPQITRVCRQLHDEAIPFLYSMEFGAHPSLLTSFPHYASEARPILSSTYISLIRNWRIWVRLDCDTRYTKEDVTKAFSGMESVTIDVYEASYKASGLHLLEKFSGIRGVKCAAVQGTVPDELAVWLEQGMESETGKELSLWKGTNWDMWEDGNR